LPADNSDDEPSDRLPEVKNQPKKNKDIAFKSSFGPQSLKQDDVRQAVTNLVPQVKNYNKMNIFQ